MKEVLSNYIINQQTLALIPFNEYPYQAIVYEGERKIYVKQKPLDIIKTTCLEFFTSYTGIREAVQHKVGIDRKIPLPISPHQNIYTFPTLSPENQDCTWLFYNHIHRITPITFSFKNPYQSIITFQNGIELSLDISHYILEKQMYRMGMCVKRFQEAVFS